MTNMEKQEIKGDVILSALLLLYRDDLTKDQRIEIRKQVARIEKLFGYEPNSFMV